MINHTLEGDLATHEAFKARLKDRAFALDAYHYLRNAIMHDDGSRHFLSQRSIGELIADLREENEDYTEFYLSDLGLKGCELQSAGNFDAELAELLAEIGWNVLTVEQEILLYQSAIRRLDESEVRREGPTPSWFSERFGNQFQRDEARRHSPIYRLQFLAFTGRIDLDDVEYISRNIFLSEPASSFAVDYRP